MIQVDDGMVARHLDIIFGKLPPSGYINVRGIGEKGTDGEGVFRDDKFIDLSDCPNPVAEVVRHVRRWSEHGRGSFIVPAILSDARGTSANVKSFRSLVVDLDSGDIQSKHSHLAENVGQPTAVVYSGGMVDGQRKRHLWWSLDKPCDEIEKAIEVRDALARKGGGDIQFGLGVATNPYGRAHQPVRLAGSIHNKGGNPSLVSLDEVTPVAHGINTVMANIAVMPIHPEVLSKAAEVEMFKPESGGELDLTEEVREGGDDEKNRWSQFSRVTGYYLSTVRRGQTTLDEAKQQMEGWVATKMVPPWPSARVEQEWNALVQRDLANHGPYPEPVKPMIEDGHGLEVWAAHRWSLDAKPQRRFIVDKLILAGKHHMLVAEGGAGKTFLMLDLAIKIASVEEGEDLNWCGGKVKEGGTVVILTTEDDKDELHIRLADIDPDLRRERAGDKLIILPTINSGGSFALVEKDPKTQEARPSRRWAEFFALLKRLPDLKLVVIDTLNSTLHGEENSATVTNEFVRVASQVCGELGAALIITHHIRKQGSEPIRGIEDMKSAIRGSSALPAAFRAVLGIWHCSDYDRRLTAMGLPPRKGHLWKMGILKANNPEMFDGEKTLLRQESGLLLDVTERDQFSTVNIGERHAWLALAVEQAANAGHPYTLEGKNAKSGLYLRRNELPPILRHVGPGEFSRLVDDLLQRKVVVAAAAKGGRDKKWLDLPTGPIASDEAGAEISSGAYKPPRWEAWTYDASLSCCIRA